MNPPLRGNHLILYIVLFMAILPIFNVGPFGVPVLYFLIPIGLLIFLLISLGKIKIPKIIKPIILIWLLIIVEIFISTLYGTVSEFNKFIFPTDTIQYIARFLFLISFIIIFFRNKVDIDIFIKYFLVVLNIGMLIGVMQWIPWPGRELLVRLYPFTNEQVQLEHLSRSLHNLRIHGIAQFATANGGLAVYFFTFGYAVFKYYKKYKILCILLITLSIINVFASQARAGILALVFSILILYLVNIYITRKSFKSSFYFVITFLLIYFIGVYMYNHGNQFIQRLVYRWSVLFETNGGARTDQITYSLGLLRSPGDYMWGLSRAFQSHSSLGFHIEVEPVNILVLYGVLGFFIQYLLVVFLCIYFFKNLRNAINNKASLTLLITSLVGLLSYQIFSVGYFFFREIRVGLFPWILMGVAIGVYERYKIIKRENTILNPISEVNEVNNIN